MSNNFYKDEYMPKINRIGKMTGYVGVILAFLPAVALAVVYGLLPKPAALLTAFVSGASAFGVLWFVEPISYFPVVGPAGTYMAFLSGNISNMRIPCASMAQVAADVEPGTEKGSVIATIVPSQLDAPGSQLKTPIPIAVYNAIAISTITRLCFFILIPNCTINAPNNAGSR